MKTQIKNKMTALVTLTCITFTNTYSQSLRSEFDDSKQLYGFKDESDKWVVTPKYKEVDAYFGIKESGLFWVTNQDGKYGYVDAKGKEFIKCEFDETESKNGYILVTKKISEEESRKGVLDSMGKIIVPVQYIEITNKVADGGFIVHAPSGESGFGGYGVIDLKGTIVVPTTYPYIADMHKGIVVAKEENPGLFGLIDLKNKVVLPYSYDQIGDFSVTDHLASAEKNSKIGFINTQGKVVIPLQYEKVWSTFTDGFIPAKKNGKWGIISSTNEVVIPFTYDNITFSQETKYTFKLNGKNVVIDAKTKKEIVQ